MAQQTEHTTAPEADVVDEAPLVEAPLIEDDLVEEVSIDGMCGVY